MTAWITLRNTSWRIHHPIEASDMKRKTETPRILEAVMSRDLDRVRGEIEAGVDINAKDRDGRTCLCQSIVDGNDDIPALLIEHGVDVNAQDNNGETALHFAAREHRLRIAELLLKSGAEVDAKDTFGNSPLGRAVFASRGRGELITLLLANGANRESKNDHDMSPLDLAKSIANYSVLQFIE